MRRPLAGLAGKIRDMRLLTKLSLSHVLAVTLCAVALSVLYLTVGRNLTERQSDMLMEKNLQQAKSSITYQLDLFTKVSDVLYNNLNLQDLLFREYYDAFSRASAMNEILTYLTPISETLTNVSEFSVYAANPTIPEHQNILKRLERVAEEPWYRSLDRYDDSVIWMLTRQRVVDVSASSTEPVTGVVLRQDEKISLVRNLRNLRVSAFAANYLGVLKIDVDPNVFFQSLAATDINQVMLVMDESGQLLFHQGNETAVPVIRQALITEKIMEAQGLAPQVTTASSGREASEGEASSTRIKPEAAAFHVRSGEGGWVVRTERLEPVGWQVVYGISTDAYARDTRALVRSSIVVTLGIILLLLLVSLAMARGFSRRILLLAESMKRLEGGGFGHVPEEGGADEVGRLIHGYNAMSDRLRQLIEESYHSRIRDKEHELQLLQAHINPHFLYNTLASIGWIARRHGIMEIADLTTELVRFYKSAMSSGGNHIPIEQELAHVKAYLAIQQFRFKDRIHVRFDIDPTAAPYQTVRFVLQPFVENALLHGMSAKKRSITICIRLSIREDMLRWQVVDDGVGMDATQLTAEGQGSGYGVHGVDQRIRLLHGEPYGVTVFSDLGVGTSVLIRLPLLPADCQSASHK